MNDPAPLPPPSPSGRSQSGLLARITPTHLALVVLVAVFVWQWLDVHNQLGRTEREVAGRLAEVEAANRATQMLVTQNQELVRELGGRLSLLESRFAETQSQRLALEQLYQEMSGSRGQQVLAEVEQMLFIANQQLQLAANVKAALIALQQAETRLSQSNRPGFADLRRQIARDIDRLRALPAVDMPGISLKLNSVIAAVDGLALVQERRVAETAPLSPSNTAESAWRRWWREFWQELRQLIRIERTGQEELPLLSPQQSFFLRENLKLKLLSARLALLTHDEENFRRELKTAQDWLKRYFDTHATPGTQVLATLQQLATATIVVEMPDLNLSLEAVRSHQARHERGVR